MTPNRTENYCCGGGGGTVSIDEIRKFRTDDRRQDQGRPDPGAPAPTIVVAPCANCKKQVRGGLRGQRPRRARSRPARPDPEGDRRSRLHEGRRRPRRGRRGHGGRLMDAWIALARGPLFRVALAACLLGLAYHLGNTLWMIRQSHQRSTDKELPLGAVFAATLGRPAPSPAAASGPDDRRRGLPRRHPAGADLLRGPRDPLAAFLPAPLADPGTGGRRRAVPRRPGRPGRPAPVAPAGADEPRAHHRRRRGRPPPPSRRHRQRLLGRPPRVLARSPRGPCSWSTCWPRTWPCSSPRSPRSSTASSLPSTRSSARWRGTSRPRAARHVALALGKENEPV